MKNYFDLVGDGGSQIVEQVAEQRSRIVDNLSGLSDVIAIGSGKGGVGKSTVTMLLALALADRGRRTAILDADFNGPSQAKLGGLDLMPPVPGPKGLQVPLTSAGVGVVSFGTLVPEPEPVEFSSVAEGDSFTWRATKEFSILGELLGGCDWRPFDLLLLDLPPGAERTFQFAEFLGERAGFLLVTIPSNLSFGVVARSAAAVRKASAPLLGYVENMSGYYCRECGKLQPLFPASNHAEIEASCLGRLPFDPGLSEPLGPLADLAEPVSDELRRVCDSLLLDG